MTFSPSELLRLHSIGGKPDMTREQRERLAADVRRIGDEKVRAGLRRQSEIITKERQRHEPL